MQYEAINDQYITKYKLLLSIGACCSKMQNIRTSDTIGVRAQSTLGGQTFLSKNISTKN